eukprot:TRINITY_DN7658_c0_g1_i1.p1 TRINITY_DN7658_c0_g1~~TRINITY_DN7658_c0_g1_i1.p1  ORF type:complete len:539 (+),score=199.26 TRINITY_DN7658_c0_g1_i1:255-1871(+)
MSEVVASSESESEPLLSSDKQPLIVSEDVNDAAASALSDGKEEKVSRLSYGLSTWGKIAYGFGNFSRYAALGIQAFYLNTFLLEVALVDPFFAGTLLLLKQAYDAVTDPFVGKLSDNSWTRWGRRKPWIMLASIPSGIFWVMMWLSPEFINEYEWGPSVYYLLVLLAFNTLNTCVSVPYNALVPDITTDYDDRTMVVLVQNVFGLLATTIYSTLQGVIIELFPGDDEGDSVNKKKGYAVAALVSLPAVVFPPMISALFVKERIPDDTERVDSGGLFKWVVEFCRGLWGAITFLEFMQVTAVFVLAMSAIYAYVNNFVLFAKYVLDREKDSSILVFVGQLGVMGSFFFWAIIAKRFSKKVAYLMGVMVWTITSFCMFFLDDGKSLIDTIIVYSLVIIRGTGAGVGYLIPLSMLPDICEIDEKRTGKRREGMLYSVLILFQKTGLAITMSGSSYALGLAGYSQDQTGEEDQNDAVKWTLKIICFLVPILLLLLSLPFMYFAPSRQDVAEVAQQIAGPDETNLSTFRRYFKKNRKSGVPAK